MANLAKLVEGLSTSLKAKDYEITKLMNKLESMNKEGQTSAIKALHVDQLDFLEDSTIRAIRNICSITDDIFTINHVNTKKNKARNDSTVAADL